MSSLVFCGKKISHVVKFDRLKVNTVDSRYLDLASRITAYLEVKIWSLPKHENLTAAEDFKEEYQMIILGYFFLFLHKNIRCGTH